LKFEEKYLPFVIRSAYAWLEVVFEFGNNVLFKAWETFRIAA
jgi:hypothetical protein